MPRGVLKEINNCEIYACTIYDDIIKTLIKDLKYKKQKKLAKLQAQIMYRFWQELEISNKYIILPVPIHSHRLKERHYNHMNIVADEFALLTGFSTNQNFLVRTKDTQKQFKLKKSERIKNIKNAFDINADNKPNKEANLLIIDDITSTGITLEEIIKLLKKQGYKNIKALTLATPDIWN